MKQNSRFDRLVSALLPLPFVGTAYLNILCYPLGLHAYDRLRTLLVFGFLGVVALLLLGKVLLLCRDKPESRRLILCTACLPLLYGVLQLWSLLACRDKAAIFSETLVNGCQLVSCCCALLIVLTESCLRKFLHTARIYALILSPIVFFYCARFYLPKADYSTHNLGSVPYMSLAYMLLELCVFLLLEVLLYDTDRKKATSFFPVNLALTLLFSAAIALSGTKGTILCLLFCILCVLAARALSHIYMRGVQLAVANCLVLLLFSTVLFPHNDVDNRFLSFWKELTPSTSVAITEEDRQETAAIMDKLTPPVNSEEDESPADTLPADGSENIGNIVDSVISGEAQEKLKSGAITQEEYDKLEEIQRKLNNTSTGARKYLWSSALSEIRSAPLTGHGPHSFQEKYGTYPHNFFLELAADFGLPITIMLFLFGLFVFLRLFRLSCSSRWYAAFLLYVLTFFPQAMISGSLYSAQVFFQYGFCVLLLFRSPAGSLCKQK